ncbi:MAG: ABC transporter substrate-binding protein [Elusimicrobiota bacterium]|nr:ABC transporter substrate-binding protein [Endomicrobiia bacterium]MDW8166362.1 ABC transporter substrate-binding protein [Elusimicrobiota bacterium]
MRVFKIISTLVIFLFFYNIGEVLSKTLVFKDAYNRDISITVPVKRACLLATYQLIPALKIKSQVVAIGKWAYDDPIMQSTITELDKIPAPGVGGPGLNVELLKKLNVDLVVTFRVPLEELNFLKSIGINTFAIYPNSVENLKETIKWHSIIFEKEKEGQAVLYEMEKILKIIEKRTSKIPENKRKKVVWLHSDLTSVAGGTGIINDTLLKISAINPAASIFPKSTIAKTSLETLTKLNPDIIFIWGAALFEPSDLTNNPQWKNIKAVREGKVYKLKALTTFSPKHVIDMLYMAIKVYPEYFKDINFKKIANEFYYKVFGIPFSNKFL